jgi:hypothetical protein
MIGPCFGGGTRGAAAAAAAAVAPASAMAQCVACCCAQECSKTHEQAKQRLMWLFPNHLLIRGPQGEPAASEWARLMEEGRAAERRISNQRLLEQLLSKFGSPPPPRPAPTVEAPAQTVLRSSFFRFGRRGWQPSGPNGTAQLALFGMQNRTFSPFLAAIHRIPVPVMGAAMCGLCHVVPAKGPKGRKQGARPPLRASVFVSVGARGMAAASPTTARSVPILLIYSRAAAPLPGVAQGLAKQCFQHAFAQRTIRAPRAAAGAA